MTVPGQTRFPSLRALRLLCQCLHHGGFDVVLALPEPLMALLGDPLGVGQSTQLRQMLAPGLFFFHRQALQMMRRRCLGRRGVVLVGFGEAWDSEAGENKKREQDG